MTVSLKKLALGLYKEGETDGSTFTEVRGTCSLTGLTRNKISVGASVLQFLQTPNSRKVKGTLGAFSIVDMRDVRMFSTFYNLLRAHSTIKYLE